MKTKPLTFLLVLTFLLSFVLLIGFPNFSSAQSVNSTVKVADYFEDIKIKIVDYFEDEKWKVIGACSNLPNLKVKIVDYFEDKKIKIVDYFEDKKVCITNAQDLDEETLRKLKLID